MNDSAYIRLLSRLKTFTRRYYIVSIGEAVSYTVFVFVTLVVVGSLCEGHFYWAAKVKTAFIISTLAVTAVSLVSLFFLRFIRKPDNLGIARTIERKYPQFNDRLITAVQMGGLDETELRGQSKELVDALVQNVERYSVALDLSRAVRTHGLVTSVRFALGSITAALLLGVLFPGHGIGGFIRLTDYAAVYYPPHKTIIYILREHDSIIRGEDYRAEGFIGGEKTDDLNLFYQWYDSGIWNTKPVAYDERKGTFSFVIEKPRGSFHFYLEAGDAETPEYLITVIERPDIETLSLSLLYPAYTGIGVVKRNDNDGNVRALKGTEVTVTIQVNKPLRSMSLVWNDSTISQCSVGGNTGNAVFTIEKTADYHVALFDTLGIRNINPIQYRVTALDDELPVVSIVSPPGDITLPGSMKFPIVYRARDDYGISNVALRFKLPYEDSTRTMALRKGKLEKAFDSDYLWNMSGLNLLPEDSVQYSIIVYDNDTLNGPKMGVSETRTVRLPSMTEILSDVSREQNTGLDALKRISERAARQEAELDDVAKNLKTGKKLEWSDKNALDSAKKNLQDMQKELKDVSEGIKEISERLSDEDLVAVETLDKLQKISDIMDEIAEGDIKEALKQITHANLEMDPQKVQKAIENYKVKAEDIQKKLDRIINLLEQVKTIQRFETARSLLETMAKKQAEMMTRYLENPKDPMLPREEENLAKEMETIQSEMKSSAKELREKFRINTKRLEETLESSDPAGKKKQAAGEMSDGFQAKAGESLNESNSMISDLLKEMDSVGASMKAANYEEMRKRLFTSLNELLVVSDLEEQFLKQVQSMKNDDLARRQLDVVESLTKAEKTLKRFSEVFIELSGVVDQMMTSLKMMMETAVNAFSMGNIGAGEKSSHESLKALNSNIHFLTLLLQKSAGGTAGSGLPGDLLQQLQSIADGQLSLQQNLDSDGMAQLAAEQQKLAEMLSNLNEKISQDNRLRQMLEKLAEEMDETADSMRRNEQRELVERKQLDIYRRLLDARRSRREKDESEERKSWTAKRNISIGADSLAGDYGEKERELNARFKQAMKDDFNPEYKALVRQYFESLLQKKAEDAR